MKNHVMQHLKNIFLVMATAIGLLSCDKGFDDLNINKVDPIALDPQFQMNNANHPHHLPG
jgi:hypothetical protein